MYYSKNSGSNARQEWNFFLISSLDWVAIRISCMVLLMKYFSLSTISKEFSKFL